tara:strand:+ start:401 stop:562 length:162 start_codon:yes stop_codon:yes gene_type:complete
MKKFLVKRGTSEKNCDSLSEVREFILLEIKKNVALNLKTDDFYIYKRTLIDIL